MWSCLPSNPGCCLTVLSTRAGGGASPTTPSLLCRRLLQFLELGSLPWFSPSAIALTQSAHQILLHFCPPNIHLSQRLASGLLLFYLHNYLPWLSLLCPKFGSDLHTPPLTGGFTWIPISLPQRMFATIHQEFKPCASKFVTLSSLCNLVKQEAYPTTLLSLP